MYNYTPDKIIASLAENNYFANRRIAYATSRNNHTVWRNRLRYGRDKFPPVTQSRQPLRGE